MGLFAAIGPPLVFKEVTFVKPLRTLVEKTSMPIVYLVRHPCATVMSDVTGQRNGKMPQDRQRRLGELLRQEAPELADRFADVVAAPTLSSGLPCSGATRSRVACRWCGNRRVACCLPMNSSPMTPTCTRSDASAFRLEYSDQTQAFIDSLYEIRVDGTRGPARTAGATSTSACSGILERKGRVEDEDLSRGSRQDRGYRCGQ